MDKIRVFNYFQKIIQGKKFSTITIISNNCWAGKVYQYYKLPYSSPTVGLYFYADDYIRFLKNLKYYISLDLQFISVDESKHCKDLYGRKQNHVPLAKLDDIEIVFLHYKTKEEAEEKWNRRKQRINWDNLYIKFSQMNYCTEEHLIEFCQLPFHNKILLSKRKNSPYDFEYYWDGPVYEHNGMTDILSDTNPFPGSLNLKKIFQQERKICR